MFQSFERSKLRIVAEVPSTPRQLFLEKVLTRYALCLWVDIHFMRKILFLVGLACFGLVSCVQRELRVKEYQLAQDAPNPAKPSEEFYQIGAGDSLGIVLWKEPTLSGSVKVRPDGFITLPLVNEVQVVGMTTGELRKVLEAKYKEFLTDPFVSIRVESISSAEVFLVGQVNKPGAYLLSGNETVLQILTRAGGLTIFADRDEIRVVRREGAKVKEFVVDYDAIVKGDLKQDILLRPGDRIIVP
jgi:polysaccharide export outer membrane protein